MGSLSETMKHRYWAQIYVFPDGIDSHLTNKFLLFMFRWD